MSDSHSINNIMFKLPCIHFMLKCLQFRYPPAPLAGKHILGRKSTPGHQNAYYVLVTGVSSNCIPLPTTCTQVQYQQNHRLDYKVVLFAKLTLVCNAGTASHLQKAECKVRRSVYFLGLNSTNVKFLHTLLP